MFLDLHDICAYKGIRQPFKGCRGPLAGGRIKFEDLDVRELPKNNLRILFALLPVFCVVITGT
jgi:hypothetical protein